MRREFPRAVKIAVIRRATCGDPPVTYCEQCKMPAKKWQIDHVRPDGLLGDPTLENAQLLCSVCYGIKNPKDTSAIAKAKRREAAHLGARTAPAAKIRSAPFRKSERAASRMPKPAPGRDPTRFNGFRIGD